MAPRRINVLVYSSTGTSPSAVQHTLDTLRSLLQPKYAVLPVSPRTILTEPWQSTCALLVFPGGGDLGYCRVFNGAGNRRIKQYVANGGAYLGFCAGGYYGSQKCQFEVGNEDTEVIGDRELGFFPGTCRGGALKGFEYGSECGTRAVELKIRTETFADVPKSPPEQFRSYLNGGGVFVDAANLADKGVSVLAEYVGKLDVDGGHGAAAVVHCKIEKGAAILTGPHPEFSANHLSPLAKGLDPKVIPALETDDALRIQFLQSCLSKLGLQSNERTEAKPSLSTIHMSTNDPSVSVEAIYQRWTGSSVTSEGSHHFECEQDAFDVQLSSRSEGSLAKVTRATVEAIENIHIAGTDDSEDVEPEHGTKETKQTATKPEAAKYEDTVKTLVVHNASIPTSDATPQFDHHAYYSALAHYKTLSRTNVNADTIDFGGTLLYGETVTSTSTLLEKNPTLTKALPPGTTLTATHQLSARGRGSNIWLSPPGCLMFSTVFSHPLALNTSAPLVFVQYIAAIAVAMGVRTYDESDPRYERVGRAVRLKWPNDIYSLTPEAFPKGLTSSNNRSSERRIEVEGSKDTEIKLNEYTKIGGILVNTTYASGDDDDEHNETSTSNNGDSASPSYKVILGIGLNVSNALPTTSLNALVDAYNASTSTSTSATDSTEPPLPHFHSPLLLARILTTFSILYSRFRRQGWVASGLEKLYEELWLHADQVVVLEEEGGVKARVKGVTRDWGLLRAEEVGRGGGGGGGGGGKEFALQSDGNSFDFLRGLVRRKL